MQMLLGSIPREVVDEAYTRHGAVTRVQSLSLPWYGAGYRWWWLYSYGEMCVYAPVLILTCMRSRSISFDDLFYRSASSRVAALRIPRSAVWKKMCLKQSETPLIDACMTRIV